MVISTVSWTGSMSKGSASNSITEFTILKCLIMVMARPSKSVTIKQVDWHLPISGYIKCNSDGASRGSLGQIGSGGIFRDGFGKFRGCFVEYIF